MRGWFDAFRHDGGPTLYDRANRTAVTGDVPTITFCVVFITLFVAFLIIFPGIRKEVSLPVCHYGAVPTSLTSSNLLFGFLHSVSPPSRPSR